MEKKEQIIAVATQLFAERGFENTPISLICETVKVSKGLVFHHFKSKNDLLREIFSRTTAIIKAINEPDASSTNATEKLRALVTSFFTGLADNRLLFQFNLNMMLQPSTRAILKDLIEMRASFLLRSVQNIFEEIDKANAVPLSYSFIAELDGIALHYFSIYDDYPLDQIKAHLIHKYS